MAPSVTVLQLDTDFPRVPGDVGSAETYIDPIEVLRIPSATVAHVVSGAPQDIDIAPFEAALRAASGEVIVTSCGFLSYWQAHLAALADRPVIASSLVALDRIARTHAPDEVMIVTFDAGSLGAPHLGRHGAFAASIVGLYPDMHLRQVIGQNLPHLDQDRAAREMRTLIADHIRPVHRCIVLECTNLPPYKPAIRDVTPVPVIDILTEIEAARPGTVKPAFLSPTEVQP
ncbi:aspartate/glutamate racemase family protein [uncultured Tateyamaria sp.]|uniref:aspartate/glutamate racemase family protein n=1 Tax=uncultured Tateyamaria sp. TaxID=455651 RepID=UPI00261A21B3|nr:aspartate/glutamate racemase family protein [uncultured Tateyamaria sp.]